MKSPLQESLLDKNTPVQRIKPWRQDDRQRPLPSSVRFLETSLTAIHFLVALEKKSPNHRISVLLRVALGP